VIQALLKRKRYLATLAVAVVCLGHLVIWDGRHDIRGFGLALAASSVPPEGAADELAPVRELIARKQWGEAIAVLKKLDDTGNADWNNLMGYSLRKAGTPDYAAAEQFYDAALRIEPGHRGALEYSGELYLITGRLPLAEQRLATLAKVCTTPCEEYTDLANAIRRYKAAGNRYVPAP